MSKGTNGDIFGDNDTNNEDVFSPFEEPEIDPSHAFDYNLPELDNLSSDYYDPFGTLSEKETDLTEIPDNPLGYQQEDSEYTNDFPNQEEITVTDSANSKPIQDKTQSANKHRSDADDTTMILNSVINNTDLTSNLAYLEDTLVREDFIIYFYAREFHRLGINKLTRRGLMAALESNAIYWLNKNSILNKRTAKEQNELDSEYLSIATNRTLYSEADCCDALRSLVLKRFDDVSSVNAHFDEEEMRSVVEGHKLTAQIKFAEDVALRAYNLLSGDKKREYINGVVYESGDILAFIHDLSLEYINTLNNSTVANDYDSYQSYLRQMCRSISSTDIVFKWNLGEQVIGDLVKGWMVSISAPPKQGKTRFTLGEMVYPALKAGRNVDYYSGEMKLKDIIALLIVKYLYSEYGMDLSSKKLFTNVGIALQISAKLQSGLDLTPAEVKALDEMGKDFFSIILLAQNKLMGYNSTFGKLNVISLTDDEESNTTPGLKTKTEQKFIVENLENNIMTSIKSRAEEYRPDMIVFDHAGHFSSAGKLTMTETLREVYAIGHKLAGNKLHPFLSVVINHTVTEQGERAREKGKFDGSTLRAFGTSEAGKSAEVDLSLVSTDDQDKDGQVTLIVNYDRWSDQKRTFKTNAFTMVANKGTCEFTLVGCTKKAYAEKKDIDGDVASSTAN